MTGEGFVDPHLLVCFHPTDEPMKVRRAADLLSELLPALSAETPRP